MAQFTAEFWQDLRKPMRDRYGGAVLYTGNAQANVLTVHLTENGEPYTGGGTISGTAIRANSTTVPLTDGSISADGTITVTLIPNCYLVAGYLHVYINVTTGSTVTTVLSVIYSVNATSVGTPIDPSGEITLDVNTLVNRINTATATIPASYETLMYSVAPAYSDLDFPIDAGLQLCWYDGQLYVNNVDIAAAESWTPAHWDACDVSGQLADFKHDLVLVQSTQPDSEDNRLWVPDTTSEVEVPTYDEFQDLKSAVDNASHALALTYSNGIGRYLKTDGTTITATSFDTSDFFTVTGGAEYFIHAYAVSGDEAACAFYTTNAVSGFISGSAVKSDGTAVVTAPATATYARLSTRKAVIATADAYISLVANTKESADIKNINSTIRKNVVVTPVYTQGSIQTDTGENTSSQASNRIRSNYIAYQKPFSLILSDGLRYSYRTYKNDGTFIASSDWLTAPGELYLDDNVASVRFVLSYSSGDISPDDNFTFEISTAKKLTSSDITYKNAMLGNVSVRAAKVINYSDGTPPEADWYLLQTPTNQFYRSKDMITKEYLFDFDMPNGVANWSAGITSSNDVIFVADAAGLSDSQGRLSDANRINPVCFLASENYSTMHTIDFGSSLKPCGWLGNVGYCVLPNGNIIFAEYTRGTVKTANVWKIAGDITNPSNWVATWSTNIIDTMDTTTAGIKHCHEVQYDFYTGIVYFGTGDSPQGSYNYYSTDNGANWTLLYGPDKDRCRRLTYVFTPDKVYWASDSYESAYHHFWIAERDNNGIVDVEHATSVSLDSTNTQACYGCVYLQSLNAVVMMDRIDGNGGTTFNWYCYDISANAVKLIGSWTSVNNAVEFLGFRCKYVDWYPVDNAILTGFNPQAASFNPDTNQNALCGNLAGTTGNGTTRINNMVMHVYKNGTEFTYRASTLWV